LKRKTVEAVTLSRSILPVLLAPVSRHYARVLLMRQKYLKNANADMGKLSASFIAKGVSY
jgi:hypothetical protein